MAVLHLTEQADGSYKLAKADVSTGADCGVTETFDASRLDIMTARAYAYQHTLQVTPADGSAAVPVALPEWGA